MFSSYLQAEINLHLFIITIISLSVSCEGWGGIVILFVLGKHQTILGIRLYDLLWFLLELCLVVSLEHMLDESLFLLDRKVHNFNGILLCFIKFFYSTGLCRMFSFHFPSKAAFPYPFSVITSQFTRTRAPYCSTAIHNFLLLFKDLSLHRKKDEGRRVFLTCVCISRNEWGKMLKLSSTLIKFSSLFLALQPFNYHLIGF